MLALKPSGSCKVWKGEYLSHSVSLKPFPISLYPCLPLATAVSAFDGANSQSRIFMKAISIVAIAARRARLLETPHYIIPIQGGPVYILMCSESRLRSSAHIYNNRLNLPGSNPLAFKTRKTTICACVGIFFFFTSNSNSRLTSPFQVVCDRRELVIPAFRLPSLARV